MSSLVVIAMPGDARGRAVADLLEADLVPYAPDAFRQAFERYGGIVAIMAVGIVVRKIAPLLRDKWTDPCVVAVGQDMRYAVPVVGGHHGANELAKRLTSLGVIPVITTATEAVGLESVEQIASRMGRQVLNRGSTREVNATVLRAEVPLYAITGPGIVVTGPGVSVLVSEGEYVLGLGCRKGVGKEEVLSAIRSALREKGLTEREVMVFATTRKKKGERGLSAAVEELGGNLVYVDDGTINAQPVTPSPAVAIGLRGVSEPCALAVSRRHELVSGRKVYGNVTVAIAR